MRAHQCVALVTEGVSIDEALAAYLNLDEGKGVKAKQAAKKKAKAERQAAAEKEKSDARAKVERDARPRGLSTLARDFVAAMHPEPKEEKPKAPHEPKHGYAELRAKAAARKGYNALTHHSNITGSALAGAKLGATYGVVKELYRRHRARKRGIDREKVNLLKAAAKPALKMAGAFGAIGAIPVIAGRTKKGSAKMREVLGKVTGAEAFQ